MALEKIYTWGASILGSNLNMESGVKYGSNELALMELEAKFKEEATWLGI